uniref:Uncharacterized protein n=1 Tax=Arion vulgaris TaxID=1028688 RepID=A0A0B7C0Q1_9EUPU
MSSLLLEENIEIRAIEKQILGFINRFLRALEMMLNMYSDMLEHHDLNRFF